MVAYYSFYTNTSEQNSFQNISSNSQTSTKIPAGYSYISNAWQNLYNTATTKFIGRTVFNGNYVNYGDVYGNYILIKYVYFIHPNDQGIPVGSIAIEYNLLDLELASTPYVYPTITCLTGEYFGKNVKIQTQIGTVTSETIISVE